MDEPREYGYVGPEHIRDAQPRDSQRVLVRSVHDVIRWIEETNQPREHGGLVVATFIIDTMGQLWINDRRSEHVRCAAGGNVLSAGEMTFEIHGHAVDVVEVTNQSTGYCPEPESWPAVEQALGVAGISHPDDFTMKCLFRLCDNCGSKNIVKDSWFVCGVCEAPLSEDWNFDPPIEENTPSLDQS